jgi:hypothetical protein
LHGVSGRVVLSVAAGYAVQEVVEGVLGDEGVKGIVQNELNRLKQERWSH